MRGPSILVNGKVVVTVPRAQGLVELEGVSGDGKWILYAIDPMASASIAADGLTLKAVSANGGRSYAVASGLLYDDYRAWCDGKLALTAGGDRYAAHHKWLILTKPPSWKAHRIVSARQFSFGSMTCLGNGIVVQAAPDALTMKPHWELWRFGFEGAMSVVDTPPSGWSDDSPQVGRDGTIYFVRTRNGNGELYARRNGRLVGPLLSLGHEDGFFGHTAWPYTVRQ